MLECERCQHIFSMDGLILLCSENEDTCAQDEVKASLREQVQELERELAQTKLQMVESKCKIQVKVFLLLLTFLILEVFLN